MHGDLHDRRRAAEHEVHRRKHDEIPRQHRAEHREAIEGGVAHHGIAQRKEDIPRLDDARAGVQRPRRAHSDDIGDNKRRKPRDKRRCEHGLAAHGQRVHHAAGAA